MAEVHAEPIPESSSQDIRKEGSNRSLNEGSKDGSQRSTSSKGSVKESSVKDIKAQIFTSQGKESSPTASKRSSLGSVKGYESPKSTGSAGLCKTFITTSTGSIRSVELPKSSTDPLKSHEGSKESTRERSSKGLLGSGELYESYRGSIESFGSEGPCRVYDTICVDEDKDSQTSAQITAEEVIGDIIADNIPVPAKAIVKEIVDKAMDRSSAEEVAQEIIELMLPGSKSSLMRKSAEITFMPDDEYLKKHLGVPLSYALVETVMKQPEDPIHYLAHWLFKWRWNQEHKQQKEDNINALNMERLRIKEEAEERERIEAEKRAIEEEMRMANEEARSIVEQSLEKAFEVLHVEEEDTDLTDEAADTFDTEEV